MRLFLPLLVLICFFAAASPSHALFSNNSDLTSPAQKKLEELNKNPPQTADEAKELASSCANTKDYKKALKIIERSLEQNPDNKELLDLALEYAMAEKNWSKALVQVDKQLKLNPNSEKFLKIKGDLCAVQKDFASAITAYEKLEQNHSTLEYSMTLASLYEANKNFIDAEKIIEPLYKANPDNKELVDIYLNLLMAQQKTREAYSLVKKHNLEYTPKGYRVLGDMAFLDKQFTVPESYFEKLIPFNVESKNATQRLAVSRSGRKKLAETEKNYKKMLDENKDNIDAKMGLGYVEIDKRNFKKAREYFNQVLAQLPTNNDAKMGIIYSYIGNIQRLKALEELRKMPVTDETKLTIAQTYYDLGMFSDSKEALKGVVNKDAAELREKIRKDDAFVLRPIYSFLIQTLADNYKLDMNRFGIVASKSMENNLTAYGEYNIYVYSSGKFGTNQLNNVVNELKGGVLGRRTEKLEIQAEGGSKLFEFGGGMLITDSWLKYHYNDKFNLKFGVVRDNIEQSYLSAVGFPINGIFTGRAATNKLYVDYDIKLPKDFYAFGRLGCAVITAQNLPTNNFAEGMLGIGKLVYNNPENKWINTINLDVVSYNMSYKQNLLKIKDAAGNSFGGYYSPSYYTAQTFELKAEGKIKKWHIQYGIKAFAGPQLALSPDLMTLAWCYSPYLAYTPNDRLTFGAAYTHFNVGDIKRDSLMLSANIKCFRKDKNTKQTNKKTEIKTIYKG